MPTRAKEGTCLAVLVRTASRLCQAALRQHPRSGPGRKPEYSDAMIATMITVAVLKHRKSKSAQYRFLHEHRREFMRWWGLSSFPARSTYFDRYRQAHRLLAHAIELHGLELIEAGVVDPTVVAVDKSLLRARGPNWNRKDRKRGRIPPLRGIDRDSEWGYSTHHGWVQGYSYEVVVTASEDSPVCPLCASVTTANISEKTSFADKIDSIPTNTRYVLADGGYNKNEFGERLEDRSEGRCQFVSPPGRMFQENPPSGYRLTKREQRSRARRVTRAEFYNSRQGKKLYRRRGMTVEPFNDWFKGLFDLGDHVWHRGLANNQTHILACIFAYQLLIRYNHDNGNHNGRVKWILDTL